MDDDRVKRGNAKDTRKWCRGRVGVPHVKEWRNYGVSLLRIECEVCSVCGRHLRVRNAPRVAV